jgi:hypothetical protein
VFVIRTVIEIIAAILTLNYIWSPQLTLTVLHSGVLIIPVNNAFIFPVCKFVNGRRITDIVIHAELVTAKSVMTAIDIDPVTKNVGLAIWNIFI